MPNITGKLGGNGASGVYDIPLATSAFKNVVATYYNVGLVYGNAHVSSFEFDASCSSTVYKDKAHVIPLSIATAFLIRY